MLRLPGVSPLVLPGLVRWNRKLAPRAYRDSRPRKINPDAPAHDVEDYPDSYQYERGKRFGVCPKAIWQALRKPGVIYKKSSEPSKGKRRQTYTLPGRYPRHERASRPVVYIDESGFSHDMPRTPPGA